MDYYSYINSLVDCIDDGIESWVADYRKSCNIEGEDEAVDDYLDSFDDVDFEEFSSYLSPNDFGLEGFFDGGAYKLCFIPANEDFVVKFYLVDTKYSEKEISNKAQNTPFGDIFYKVVSDEYVFDFGNNLCFTAYCQEKANALPEDKRKKTSYLNGWNKKVKTDSERVSSWVSSCDGSFSIAILECYGEEIAEKLFAFLDDCHLHDFHSGNWVVDHDKVRIMDYSSLNFD